ncbi:MAG: YraN family protein [Candidatus Limnocylindria bacterium]|nr:YraN family protein [Candidatus Limnocylindria bacterium]
MSDPRRALGTLGERAAERALEARGLRVVERNARTRYGEIDLVCLERSGYVFAEVKTRHATSFVAAAEAVGPRKLARLASLAEAWLALHGERGAAWRLAVVALTIGEGPPRVEIIEVD